MFFYSNSILAKVYKCTDNNKISYTSMPCKATDNKEEINIKVNRITPEKSCLSTCSSKNVICISKLKEGKFNKDGGLKMCRLKKDWCDSICKKENKLDIVSKKYTYKLEKNNYNYKKSINKINENEKKRRKQRIYKWHQKRKKEISVCIEKGMVKINRLKLRSLAWKREKKLKNNCKRRARSKTYGVY